MLDLEKSINYGISYRILEMMLGKDYEQDIQETLQSLLRKRIITKEKEFFNQWGVKTFYSLS